MRHLIFVDGRPDSLAARKAAGPGHLARLYALRAFEPVLP